LAVKAYQYYINQSRLLQEGNDKKMTDHIN
jgi:hypothetical protein